MVWVKLAANRIVNSFYAKRKADELDSAVSGQRLVSTDRIEQAAVSRNEAEQLHEAAKAELLRIINEAKDAGTTSREEIEKMLEDLLEEIDRETQRRRNNMKRR